MKLEDFNKLMQSKSETERGEYTFNLLKRMKTMQDWDFYCYNKMFNKLDSTMFLLGGGFNIY